MKNLHRLMFAVCVALALLAAACQTVPLTGRHQLMLISPDEERGLGEEAYKKTLKSATLSEDHAAAEMIRRSSMRCFSSSRIFAPDLSVVARMCRSCSRTILRFSSVMG